MRNMVGLALCLFFAAQGACTRGSSLEAEPRPRPARAGGGEAAPEPARPETPAELDAPPAREPFSSSHVVAHIRTRLRAVQACYETALADDPQLEGLVRLQFDVTPEGRIEGTHAEHLDPGTDRFAPCLVEVFEGARVYRGRAVEETVTFSYPFVFAPQTEAVEFITQQAPDVGYSVDPDAPLRTRRFVRENALLALQGCREAHLDDEASGGVHIKLILDAAGTVSDARPVSPPAGFEAAAACAREALLGARSTFGAVRFPIEVQFMADRR